MILVVMFALGMASLRAMASPAEAGPVDLVTLAARFLRGSTAGDPVTADLLALKSLDHLLQQQAQVLAYFDTLLLCGVEATALIPLIFPSIAAGSPRAPDSRIRHLRSCGGRQPRSWVVEGKAAIFDRAEEV